MANTAIAEVRGAADRSITVINQSPKLLEQSESVEDMTPIRYTVGRKAKNCKKGKPCGGSCISNAKSCRIGLSADQKALAVKAKKTMQGGGGDASDPGEEDRNELAEAFLYRYKAAQIKKFKKLANDPPYWEDVMILNGYTSDDYRPINKHLREGSKIDPDLKIAIKRADVALKAMPKFEGTVYRGADLSQDLIDRYKVGETIAERAYVSTSRSKKQAFEGNVRFVIQSKNGVDVSDLSEFKKEQEVLIPRDSKFKVLDKQIKGAETIIFMEEAS
jgi:hypothetical protein